MKTVRLSDIALIQSGGTPKRSNSLYWENGNIPWVKIGDIKSKYLKECEEFITVEGLKNSSAKIFNKGSILYTIFATLGEVAILDMDAATNQAIAGITVQDKRVNVEYLYYYLKSIKHDVNNLGRGVAQNNINLSILKNLSIPIRSDCEQIKIVNCLNFVTKIIEQKNRQLNLLDELVKSRFVEMFGGIHNSSLYPYVTIECFTTVISGGTPNRGISEYWQDGRIRWVKSTELHNCVITDTEEKITQLGMSNSSAKLIPADSVLIAMYGQGKTRGMTGYLAVTCTTNQACACILPSPTVNQKYLWQYMILSYDKLRNMAKGGNQPNLNVGIIKKFPVLMPPLELQEQFAAFVSQIDKSRLAIQKSLDEAQLLFDSLMQKYFG
ncbi:restriction endonuclease subunit S [Megasphaera stantonii]|uniref:restriction endonuclease subunit S n=1 Tax=Megasphaera stantonii TaxID=2144175 RepID=UPI001DC040B0|nr:restriction endonuclease subunit S [Megasphaera stantonii]HJE83621.1 restriction endonuclease subunit S [Megasphaera stantonii]